MLCSLQKYLSLIQGLYSVLSALGIGLIGVLNSACLFFLSFVLHCLDCSRVCFDQIPISFHFCASLWALKIASSVILWADCVENEHTLIYSIQERKDFYFYYTISCPPSLSFKGFQKYLVLFVLLPLS